MEEEEVQDAPPTPRELQCAMAALTRAGKMYHILVHSDDPCEVPVFTGMVQETFEHVASYTDFVWLVGTLFGW